MTIQVRDDDFRRYVLACRPRGRARAHAVRDWFTRNGGNTDFVVIYEAGAFDPIASNETLEGRARNRRLDIYLIPGEKMVDMARRGELDKR